MDKGILKIDPPPSQRRLLERGIGMSIHSRNDREWRDVIAPRIKRRDGYVCTLQLPGCEGDKNLGVDHHVPRSKGGSDEDDNLFTACRKCNSKKGNKVRNRIEWEKDHWFD